MEAIPLFDGEFESLSDLARELDVSPQAVSMWLSGKFPVRRAIQIENLTEGRVRASTLRPDVFGRGRTR